ncbi:hypothetical protein [Salinispora arenicola]|uniref:hypothetical protein n=1 Tax=Salinispora arenicola TaxID=168697 RepID=UPI00207A7371|nr:hypothetical protein [Salinispora arenicola]MCN0154589.1 hypothetical protein [Salinispora arenicola]
MGILSQIIPGLRDARTPLAIGALWAIIGWLACSFAPAEVWKKDFFATAASQLDKLPVEVLITAMAFIVYLVGVVMQSIGAAITRFALPTFFAICGLLVLSTLVAVLAEAIAMVAAITAATLIAASLLRRRRLKSGSFWSVLEDTALESVRRIYIYSERAWRGYRTSRESHQAAFDEMTLESLEAYYNANPTFLEEKVEELTHSSLQHAALSVDLTLEEVYAETPQEEPLPPGLKSLADLRLHLADPEKHDSGIRRALRKKLHRERDARTALTQVLELSGYRDWLRRRLEQADHELRSAKPELYLDYGRMRAEGEFRSGISFPLAALIALAAYKWHLLFNAGGPTQILWALLAFALVVLIVLNNAGSQQQDNARLLLYSVVRNKTIQLSEESPFGEPIFAFRPLPEVQRSPTIGSAVRRRVRAVVRKPLQRIFPELSQENTQLPAPTSERAQS